MIISVMAHRAAASSSCGSAEVRVTAYMLYSDELQLLSFQWPAENCEMIGGRRRTYRRQSAVSSQCNRLTESTDVCALRVTVTSSNRQPWQEVFRYHAQSARCGTLGSSWRHRGARRHIGARHPLPRNFVGLVPADPPASTLDTSSPGGLVTSGTSVETTIVDDDTILDGYVQQSAVIQLLSLPTRLRPSNAVIHPEK
jgi:hypothetical protein